MTTTATPTATPAAVSPLIALERDRAPDTPHATTVDHGLLLVASDGRTSTEGALRAAGTLAGSTGASVRVVGVVEPIRTVSTEVALVATAGEIQGAMQAELQDNIASQLASTALADRSWPIEILEGLPPPVIARRAHELGATAIVLGLGRHDMTDRLFGTETALQVLRLAEVPVIAVPERPPETLRRAVIGVDFSETSLRAARLALSLFPDLVALDLVHVAPPLGPTVVATPWESAYGTELPDAWHRFVADLSAPASVLVQPFTIKGHPAETLLRHAADVGADLVVVGSHGRGFVGRVIVGSVATEVIRATHATVLAVPVGAGVSSRSSASSADAPTTS